MKPLLVWEPMATVATPAANLERAAAALRAFLTRHADVWMEEAGEPIAQLRAADSGFSIHAETGRLVCHFWAPEANLVRRVIGFAEAGERLRLQCLRLGRNQPSWLTLRPAQPKESHGAGPERRRRLEYRQAVLGAVRREWAGWSLVRAAPGGAQRQPWQRFLLRRQQAMIAAVALAEEENTAANAILAHALLWADHARRRWPQNYLHAIRLILPSAQAAETLDRGRHLRDGTPIECFTLDHSAGHFNRAEASCGNAAAALRRAPGHDACPPAEVQNLLAEVRDVCPQATPAWSASASVWTVRLHGLEIAREAGFDAATQKSGAAFVFGCGRERSPLRDSTRGLFQRFLRDLARERVANGDRRQPLYALQPERWLEHLLSHDLRALDTRCDPRFGYTQTPAWAAGDRDVLDLLAVTRAGRLLVLELKADEDLTFPLQALDYWQRVRGHQLAGDFTRMGYFPGVELSADPPLLWLLAPALRWHPDTHRLLAWVSPAVPWTMIGINEDWRSGLQILFRRNAGPGSEA